MPATLEFANWWGMVRCVSLALLAEWSMAVIYSALSMYHKVIKKSILFVHNTLFSDK